MAEAIGTALARVTSAPGCSASSTKNWSKVDLTVLTDLPARIDDRTLALVEEIAALPAPPSKPASEQHVAQCIRTLSILPGRDDDVLTAKLRFALYRKHFGHLPEAAWSFLVEKATLECRFFPTPSECAAILTRWNRNDGPWRAHQLARRAAAAEREARFEDLMARFREGEVTQAEADALPERWKRIAATRGFLRDDGTYTIRPQRPLASYGTNTPGEGEEDPQPHERTIG